MINIFCLNVLSVRIINELQLNTIIHLLVNNTKPITIQFICKKNLYKNPKTLSQFMR